MKNNIQENIPLSAHTTFRIGGPAKFFAEVGNEEELQDALRFASEKNLKIFILGGGSNTIFSDEGFDGLVIKCKSQNSKVKITNKNPKGSEIEVWAGTQLNKIVNFCRDNQLSGMENLAGIPGTIGGAVRGNAGAFGVSVGDFVEEVKTLEKLTGKIKILNNQECKFSYRSSIFKENQNLFIISIILKLQKGDKEEIANRIQEAVKKRLEKQPKGWFGSAGSFFKNPKVDGVKNKKLIEKFEKDTNQKINNNILPAGWLIAEAGLLGKTIGGAQVSEKHGNFLINTGQATAQDVIMLASLIKTKVRDAFGIELQEEVQYIG